MSGVIGITVGTPFNPDKMLAPIEEQISRNDKRITNLEQGIIPEPFVTDSSVAYIKTVPDNALPYAEIQHVGGITRKCSNLAPEDARDVVDFNTIYYVTVGNNFKEHVGEEVTVSFDIKLKTLNAVTNHLVVYAYQESGYSLAENKTFFPTTEWARYSFTTSIKKYDGTHNEGIIAFYDGNTSANGAQNVYSIRNIQINLGNTANSFEPYFEGFRTSKVTEIESVGSNLLPYPYVSPTKTYNGISWTDNGDGSITVKGTATDYSSFYLYNNEKVAPKGIKPGGTYVVSSYANKVYAYFNVYENGTQEAFANSYDGTPRTYLDSYRGATIYLLVLPGDTVDAIVYPTINEGSTALPYTPYKKHTIPIPESVQALEGYGISISNVLFNYIDWENQLFVERVGKKILNGSDSENWNTRGSTTSIYTTALDDEIKRNTQAILHDSSFDFGIGGGTYCTAVGIYGAYTTDSWKAYLNTNPITVYYELAEPRYTDISHLISADNFIEVEGGGTIIADNDYLYAVPTVITYMLKEEGI